MNIAICDDEGIIRRKIADQVERATTRKRDKKNHGLGIKSSAARMSALKTVPVWLLQNCIFR